MSEIIYFPKVELQGQNLILVIAHSIESEIKNNFEKLPGVIKYFVIHFESRFANLK